MWFKEFEEATSRQVKWFMKVWTISQFFLQAEVWSCLPFLFGNTHISGRHVKSPMTHHKSVLPLSIKGRAFGQPRRSKNLESEFEQNWSRPTLQANFLLAFFTLGFFCNVSLEKLYYHPFHPRDLFAQSGTIELVIVGTGPTKIFSSFFLLLCKI